MTFRNPLRNDEAEKCVQVPSDFPRQNYVAAVSGHQSKLPLKELEGRYYGPNGTPQDVRKRWAFCEDIAQQFVVKYRDSQVGKRAHMTEADIISQYYERAIRAGWSVTFQEWQWIFRRVAAVLGWPVPNMKDQLRYPQSLQVYEGALKEFTRRMNSAPKQQTDLQARIQKRLQEVSDISAEQCARQMAVPPFVDSALDQDKGKK